MSLKFTSIATAPGEIGYVFSPDVAGHGYATEAMEALVALMCEQYGFHLLVARIDEENAASIALAERLGMRCEARLVENDVRDGEWSSQLIYSVLDREWR